MLKQKTVYFREEDLELWDKIENKAQFLHLALNPEELKDKIDAVCTGHETMRMNCGRKGCQYA